VCGAVRSVRAQRLEAPGLYLGMPDTTQRTLPGEHDWLQDADRPRHASGPGLGIAWCLAEPGRIGEVAVVHEGTRVLGRGTGAANLFFREDRPGRLGQTRPFAGRLMSRRQLEVTRRGDALEIHNVGSRGMRINGQKADAGTLTPGDILEIDKQLVLVAVSIPDAWPETAETHPFGEADPAGIVGEGSATWELREQLSFLARQADPVLITGESGSGKELAARALHLLSSRSNGPFVARNSATLPEGLVDAELFGNAANYPNAGLPERPGIIGSASGGTLFLDEIGEMPVGVQAHLLRVLDDGEYQRLGDAKSRRADLRFVAATNRNPSVLKHDVLSRLTLRLELPGLTDRISDIPLIARHLLREAARDPAVRDQFFDGPNARISPDLMVALLRHRWTTHVRQLKRILWISVRSSPGKGLALTEDVRQALGEKTSLIKSQDNRQKFAKAHPVGLDAATVQSALDAANGNVTNAAQALGLPSRYALYRLIRKFGLGKAP